MTDRSKDVLHIRSDEIDWVEAGGEVIALDHRSAVYVSANSTGTVLWRRLLTGATRHQLIQELTARFAIDGYQAARDVDAFLDQLESAKLLFSLRMISGRLAKLPGVVLGAWWTLRSVREARRRLREGGLSGFSLTPPPPLPPSAERGMWIVLRRLHPSCLEGALVRQCWLAAHGQTHDVVVGVRKAGPDFSAHAWIDADEPWQRGDFHEIARFGA